MTIEVAAFRWVPEFARGYVRDLRVRWALEEADLPYEARLIDREIQKSEEYRDWQPFGQVPAYRDDEVEMFESGAIVLHIAAKSEALAPRDPAGQARVQTWVMAALNSVEPPIMEMGSLNIFHAGEAWTVERRPQVEAAVRRRLVALDGWLDGKDFLEGRFTAGDLIMASVLRNLRHTGLVAEHANLAAYLARCEARPGFQQALAEQLADFDEREAA